MALLARCRLALARHPSIYWLAVACCAAVAWTSLQNVQSAARQAARSWGTSRTVWVTASDTPVGAPIHAIGRDYPVAAVPGSALRRPPAGAWAVRPISAGEVLVAADISGPRQPPAGWVVFALPADGAPRLQPGDGVAVFGGAQHLCDGTAAAPSPGLNGGAVEVAVPPGCAPVVGEQIAAHTIVLGRAVPSRP
jgi:hypothetical protein